MSKCRRRLFVGRSLLGVIFFLAPHAGAVCVLDLNSNWKIENKSTSCIDDWGQGR